MKKKKIRINRILIRNYKGIDELELDFTAPKMTHDPDLMVIGSENGIGKTSVIECCALLLLSLSPNFRNDAFIGMERYSSIDIFDLLIRAGADNIEIFGDIVYDIETLKDVGIRIHRDRTVEKFYSKEKKEHTFKGGIFELVRSVCGFTPNPVMVDLFLLFHSYRKVQEGNLELGMMIDHEKRNTIWDGLSNIFFRNDSIMSAFKLIILRSIMSDANLFDKVDENESDCVIEKLNELVKIYAGGKIGKLRPSVDNTIDFRINPINNESQTFSFDGLSSGQKEIISTLFLIWYNTKENPSVVFIDEPELHLNSQWHSGFVNALTRIAPQNQYILATHSEYIMDSVEKYQRIFISSGDK